MAIIFVFSQRRILESLFSFFSQVSSIEAFFNGGYICFLRVSYFGRLSHFLYSEQFDSRSRTLNFRKTASPPCLLLGLPCLLITGLLLHTSKVVSLCKFSTGLGT